MTENKAKEKLDPEPQPTATPADDRQADSLVTIQASPLAARLLEEMTLGHNTKKTVADELDLIIECSFLSDLLLDNINPEQLCYATSYVDKIELAIALLRAMRGAEGYSTETKFGPFLVHIPEDERERIEKKRTGSMSLADKVAAKRNYRPQPEVTPKKPAPE